MPIFKDVDLVVELLRIEYRGNVAKVYLPFAVRAALKLDPQKDKALVLFHDAATGTNILIKDAYLLELIKPLILKARKIQHRINGCH